ncbi:hypothetical protein NG829_02795 [Xanthomonas sacchari]|uniref:hypothetical protein n=1 Tax=Xanthomonas sacchari TaxID=56458 RepID=UPI00225E0EB3|nr:hypothetical protein [Xanthomonas sacchari]UYK81259.1 hypothetical protein NG829_02795 [Xanthomonas sacchari]
MKRSWLISDISSWRDYMHIGLAARINLRVIFVKAISLVFVFPILINGGCSVSEKTVYGNLQALDLQYAEDKSDLLVDKVGDESAARFRAEGGHVWWALNRLNKDQEIYSFPANGLTPDCRAIDKLKNSVQLDGHFEGKAFLACRK